MPRGWQLVRLGDVLKLEYGVSLPERVRMDGNVPVIGSAGVVGFHSQAATDGPGIVVGRKGSIGSITWTVDDFVAIDTTYFVVPIDGKIDLRWAYYLLTREDLSRLNRATGIPGLNRDDVYTLTRLLPPLPEQRAIAAVLDSIGDAIEGTEAVIAATEQLRDSLLHQLLTRGVPGWHTAWKDVPGLGTIPAAWEVVRLGDILFNRTNSRDLVGKVVIVRDLEQPVSFASYLIRLRAAKTRANPYWLVALLGSSQCQDRIRKFATPGVSQANINPTNLKSLTISLPSLAEQQTVARVLDGADATLVRVRQERARLQRVKDSTSDVLLTGQVRAMA